jgi:outer membrane receptor protein involved in Fe transport
MKNCILVLSCCAMMVPVAKAGNAAAEANDATVGQLAEIVVTAQKRKENINSVGMSITAETGEQLQQKGVTTVSDLTRIEPSLQFSQTQSGTPVYTLRGVGYFEQSLAASPTVSIYQDEVAFPFPVMARGVMLDTQHVEILKGPQGTLYGQNATGGAINFIANKPTDTFSAGADETFGRFNDNLFTGFVSGPVTSTLRARLSFSTENGGAWQKSETRDATLGSKDTQIGRLLLEWVPTDQLTVNLNVNGWTDHSDTQAPQVEGFRLQQPGNVASGLDLFNPASYIPAPAGSPAYDGYPAPIKPVLGQPIVSNDLRAADWYDGDHPKNAENFFQTNLRLDYSLSDAVGITSLTSFQRFSEANVVDQAGTAAAAETTLVRGDVKSYSEELRLHGLSSGKKVHWMLGGNFERDESNENDFVNPFVSTASYSPTALGLPPFVNFGALNTDTTVTKSVFGNIEYRLLPAFAIDAGVRYTKSDQDMSGCSYSTSPSVTILQDVLSGLFGGHAPGTAVPGQCVTLGPPPDFMPGAVSNTLDQSNVPWRVGLDWTPAANDLIYFTVSKGYKAGSAPALGASQADQLKPVTQESLLAYELGLKAELLDRRLQVNTAVFHYDYTNKQELGRLSDPTYGALQVLLNIPKSKEDGAEFSAIWNPVGGLALNAAVTYLDSRVTTDFFDTGPYPLGIPGQAVKIDFNGEPFPFTPKWSGLLGARYDWSLGGGLTAFVSADSSYESRSTTAFGADEAVADGAPPLQISAYGLLNLSAGVVSADNRWHVEIWGRNVTNKYYWNSVNYVSDTVVRLTGMPATYGVTVGLRY